MGRMITREKKIIVPAKFDKLKAWSFSLYRRYTGCARMVALEKLQKRNFSNAGMDGGVDMHTVAENYVNGTTKSAKVPAVLALVADHAKALRADKTTEVEAQQTLTAQFNVTGWFDSDAWLRVKVDARRILERTKSIIKLVEITDWKSGRPNADWDEKQAEVYALSEFATSGTQKVKTIFCHTDTGDETEALFKIEEQASLRKTWTAAVKKMLNDQRFEPTPKPWICSWCPHNVKNPKFAATGVCQVGTPVSEKRK